MCKSRKKEQEKIILHDYDKRYSLASSQTHESSTTMLLSTNQVNFESSNNKKKKSQISQNFTEKCNEIINNKLPRIEMEIILDLGSMKANEKV